MAIKKGGARVSKLELLHEKVAEFMIDQIEAAMDDDPDDESGIGAFMGTGDMANILKFLKDNNVTAAPDEDHMAKLNSAFKDNKEFLDARALKADSIIKGAKDEHSNLFN